MCTVLLPPGGYPTAVNKYIRYTLQNIFRASLRSRPCQLHWATTAFLTINETFWRLPGNNGVTHEKLPNLFLLVASVFVFRRYGVKSWPCAQLLCGPGSSVCIATGYGLDGPGIESRWGGGEIFRTCPDRPWGPPSLLYNGCRVFPGGKERPGVTLTPHPLLVLWSRKSRAIPLLPVWAVRPVQGCTLLLLYSYYKFPGPLLNPCM